MTHDENATRPDRSLSPGRQEQRLNTTRTTTPPIDMARHDTDWQQRPTGDATARSGRSRRRTIVPSSRFRVVALCRRKKATAIADSPRSRN